MKLQRIIALSIISVLFLPTKSVWLSSGFHDIVGSKKIMVIFTGDEEYAEYAENIIKEKLRQIGYRMIDPEMMEKVKKNKLLWEAIKNNNATAMAKISTDFGADIILKGILTVESHSRFRTQWEASATLNITVIDTETAEELLSTYSDPLGSTRNPMPVEESALVAKQVATKNVTENVALKLELETTESIYARSTFSPKYYKSFQSDGRISNIIFTPDSRSLSIVSGHYVDVIEIQSGKRTARYDVSDVITSVFFSQDGKLIAIGVKGKYVYIYERESNRLIKKYQGSGSSVTAVVFNNEGSLLAAGFKDGHIELLDVQQGKRVGYLSGHAKTVNSLAFTPNDKSLVSFSGDLTTKFWDVNVKREVRSFKEPMHRLFFADLSVDGSLIGLNGKIINIDLLRNRRTDERFLIIRNTSTGEEVKRFNLPKDISDIAFYPNKRYIASASEDRKIRIWDISTGDEISVLSLEKPASSLDFSSDGSMLAYSANDGVTVMRLKNK